MHFILSQSPAPGTDLTTVLGLVTQLGLSSVFIWLWWTERKERRELQGTMLTFMERFGPTLAEAVNTVEKVQGGLSAQLEKAAASPDIRTIDLAIRRMELAADEMGSMLRQSRRRKDDFGDTPTS